MKFENYLFIYFCEQQQGKGVGRFENYVGARRGLPFLDAVGIDKRVKYSHSINNNVIGH
jgi:hypothetical protein